MATKAFPSKLYGRFTKGGERYDWALHGHLPDDDPKYPGAAVYYSHGGGRSILTESGLIHGLQHGHLMAQAGKEILAWGDEFGAQLERLNIQAWLLYTGKGTVPSVYWLTDADFERLDADPPENWEAKDAAWRYSDGSVLDEPEKRVKINGRYLQFGWADDDGYAGTHADLLEYLEANTGATAPRNVAACAADMARANGISVGALFTKYQPSETRA